MNKSELIAAIAAKTGETKKSAEANLNAFTDVVAEALVRGEKVQLVGFGSVHHPKKAVSVMSEYTKEDLEKQESKLKVVDGLRKKCEASIEELKKLLLEFNFNEDDMLIEWGEIVNREIRRKGKEYFRNRMWKMGKFYCLVFGPHWSSCNIIWKKHLCKYAGIFADQKK